MVIITILPYLRFKSPKNLGETKTVIPSEYTVLKKQIVDKKLQNVPKADLKYFFKIPKNASSHSLYRSKSNVGCNSENCYL